MKKDILFVNTPQLGTNDSTVTLIEWHIADNAKVSKGDVICTLENTKATFDIDSEVSGYIAHLVEEGAEVSFSDNLAIISGSKEIIAKEKDNILSKNIFTLDNEQITLESNKATKKAIALAKKLSVDINEIQSENIIKEIDVKNFANKNSVSKNMNAKNIIAENDNISTVIDLIGNRKAGKDLMLFSTNNIPQSYIERYTIIDKWAHKIDNTIQNEGIYITYLSLIISGLATALKKHRTFNSFRQENKIFQYDKINIGVVISFNNEISIPVINNADEKKPEDIVKILMNIRKNILRRKPNAKDLIGATFTVSAMDHTNVTRFNPIIHPKQAAVLAIPKIQKSLSIDNNKSISEIQFMNLGISFDHSFLDASQASDFLDSVVLEIDKSI
jgi:pyruvate dehydrogenase E2 component (dihydrolipoamide acetyltransferase)